jgi:hypothetical protein
VIISIDAEKDLWQNPTLFRDKSSEETRKRRNVPHIRKTTDDKPTANITLNEEKLKAFPLKSGTRQRVSILSTLAQHKAWILSQSNKARKRNKEIQIGKEEIKLSIFLDDMILLFLKDPKDPTQKLSDF